MPLDLDTFLGSIPSKEKELYRETKAKLKDAVGRKILVVKQNKVGNYLLSDIDKGLKKGVSRLSSPENYSKKGVFPPTNRKLYGYVINETLELGILKSGLDLDLENAKIIFPMKEYVTKKDSNSNDNKWELRKGPIWFYYHEFTHLGKSLERTIMIDAEINFDYGLRLFLGNEVEKYFEKKTPFGDTYLDTSYVEALTLLGQKAPKRFRKKYDEEVYQEKVEVIDKLLGLTKREAELDENIKSIYGSIKDGGFVRDGALVNVENKSYAMIVSMEPRMELEEIRRDIQWWLKEGIKLGMHKGKLIMEQKPGIELNVPKYISGICEKYQIELPK